MRPTVAIVPFGGGLRAALERLFLDLSPRSRHQRFLSPERGRTAQELAPLMHVDALRHVAVVAVHGGEVVAEARFARPHPRASRAEVALTVADAWQGRGLGRRLLATLAGHARPLGVRRFTYEALADNRPVLHLMASAGGRHIVQDGIAAGELPLE